MKKHIYVFAILLFFLFAGKLFAVNDSCLKLIIPNDKAHGSWNPDSVMVDTCSDSPTYLVIYAKKGWGIEFPNYYYPFKIKPLPADSIVHSDAIDPNYASFKIRVDSLEQLFGPMNFMSGYEVADSSNMGFPYFFLGCNNYQIESIFYNKLLSFDSLKSLNSPQWGLLSKPEEKNISNEFSIYIENAILNIFLLNEKYATNEHRINIYNVLGECVLKTAISSGTAEYSIDISFLNNGMYFVQVDESIFKILVWR